MYTFVLLILPHPAPILFSLLLVPRTPQPIASPFSLSCHMCYSLIYNIIYSHYILSVPPPISSFPFHDPLSGLLTCRHRHTHIHMHINSNPGLLYEKGAIYNKEIPCVKSLQFAGIKLKNSNGSCSHLGLLYPSTAHKFLRCILLSFWKRDLILICSFFLTVAHAPQRLTLEEAGEFMGRGDCLWGSGNIMSLHACFALLPQPWIDRYLRGKLALAAACHRENKLLYTPGLARFISPP